MIPYEKFASVYDKMEADEFSRKMVEYTKRIMARFGIEPESGLDLCCGTGTAIELFVEHGITMSGLDRSRAMLRQARAKLPGRKVRLYNQELPRFEIVVSRKNERKRRAAFDLITCYFDSLNYLLTEHDLLTAFRSVHRHLRPGGWFIFDMNTPNALKTIWGAQVYAGVRDDIGWVFRNDHFPTKNTADCHVTFFVKHGIHWERFDETHTERGYSDRVIRSLLRQAGFTVKGYYRCFTFEKPKGTTNRICAVVQRGK
jgi:SAM-dependent methyltransferase